MKITLQSLWFLTFQYGFSSVHAFSPSSSKQVPYLFKNNNGVKLVTSIINHPITTTSTALYYNKDTEPIFPSFDTKEDYINYITEASALPKGFSIGSAVGSFIPEEAPSKGSLPIKATLIHLTDGPTDNWAATFTQNRVCITSLCFVLLMYIRFHIL